MKRLLLILLLLSLLCGCAHQPAEPTETTAPMPTQPTETTAPAQRLIVGESGDLLCYDAEGGVAFFAPMGDGWLLGTTDGLVALLEGRELTVGKTRELDCPLEPGDPRVFTRGDKFSYYDAVRGAYVTLGKNLTEISAIAIRDTVTAGPIMSHDRSTIYYCTDTGLRAMDIATGNSRLLRQEHNTIASLDALLFDGTILRYTYRTDSGESGVSFVRTADGTQVYFADLRGELASWGSRYAAVMTLALPMGDERQIVTGQVGGDVQMLDIGSNWHSVIFTEGCALVQSRWKGELALRLYDLESGSMIAEKRMTRDDAFTGAYFTGSGLWLWSDSHARFYFWQFEKAETQTYLVAQPTFSDPDTQGLQAVKDRLKQLSKSYGVTIRLVDSRERTGGVDYTGYPDCRPAQYTKAVKLLEEAMSVLPYNILSYLGDQRNLVIELVDDYDPAQGIRPGDGSLTIGDETVLRLSICGELKEIFYHELFHAMELQIHARTDKLTEWEDVNPSGFQYSGSYTAYQQGELAQSEYLYAFVDDYALISVREDRAQTFMYAMLEGQQERFQSKQLQKKLDILDAAIRTTFGYKGVDAEMKWQQYQD